MKLQVEILSFHPTPSGSASLGQVDFKITLQTNDGKDCPIIIRDAAILQDIVSSGLRLAMPRFRRGKDRPLPVILFTPRLLYDLGEQIIPEWRKHRLGQSSSAQDEKPSPQTVRELGNKLQGENGGAR